MSSKNPLLPTDRVLLVIPVEVTWVAAGGVKVTEHATTEVISAHGTLLRMRTRLPRSSEVQLRRPRTRESTSARVVDIYPSHEDGWVRIVVELAVPSESFWGVSIPSAPPAAHHAISGSR